MPRCDPMPMWPTMKLLASLPFDRTQVCILLSDCGSLMRNQKNCFQLLPALVATGAFEAAMVVYLEMNHSKHLCDVSYLSRLGGCDPRNSCPVVHPC